MASFTHSVELATMVVPGGMASTFGAVFGTTLLTVLPQLLGGLEGYEMIFFGLILMLKRLEIARAPAGKPRLLLLDAPAAGLNDTETHQVSDLIRSIADSGITVMVEHDMKMVMNISDHIPHSRPERRVSAGLSQVLEGRQVFGPLSRAG